MPKTTRTELDTPLKNRIVAAAIALKSDTQAADLFGVPRETARNIRRRFEKQGTTTNAARTGRPLKVTDRTRRHVIREVKKDRRKSYKEIGKRVMPILSTSSVKRIVNAKGMHRRKAQKVPRLQKYHRDICMTWARGVIGWDEFKWRRIIWSDESWVYVAGSSGTIYVTRAPDEQDLEECMDPQFEKSKTKVMIWACIMWNCKGPVVALEFPGGRGGGMNSDRYQTQVLEPVLSEFYTRKTLELGRVFFQQDGARCHTSKATMRYLDREGIMLFPHPSKSPDLNPIENLWWELKKNLRNRRRTPTSIDELTQAVREEWDALTLEDVNKYVSTMPKRAAAVLAAHGGNTRY